MYVNKSYSFQVHFSLTSGDKDMYRSVVMYHLKLADQQEILDEVTYLS